MEPRSELTSKSLTPSSIRRRGPDLTADSRPAIKRIIRILFLLHDAQTCRIVSPHGNSCKENGRRSERLNCKQVQASLGKRVEARKLLSASEIFLHESFGLK